MRLDEVAVGATVSVCGQAVTVIYSNPCRVHVRYATGRCESFETAAGQIVEIMRRREANLAPATEVD